jgi:acyl-CoA thioesterase
LATSLHINVAKTIEMPLGKRLNQEGSMAQTFTGLLNDAHFLDGVLRSDIPDSWMQGRTTYGGLSAALCLETALRAFPDLPPLRSANISFIGPAGGTTEGRARVLRQGKSVSFVEADLSGEAGLATRCTFAFGASRESIFNQIWTPPAEMPAPEDCEPFIPKGLGPNFASHFDTGLAKGARPGTGSKEHDHFIWVRHCDAAATGVVALVALADMPPPAVMPMFPTFKPVSSMTWMMNFLTDSPQTRDGWWLLESRAENAGQGYSSQDMLVWNRDMELVIAGRQSVAIFL